MRGKHPMHLTRAYNLPSVACGEAAKRRRRTTSAEAMLRDINPCIRCAPIAKSEIDAADPEMPT